MTLCPCSTTGILDGMRTKTVEKELAAARKPSVSTTASQAKWWLGYLICLGISTAAFGQGITTSVKDDFKADQQTAKVIGWSGAVSVALFSAKNAIEHLMSLSSEETKKHFVRNWLIPSIWGGVSAILSTVLQADEGAAVPFLICAFISGSLTNGNNFRKWKAIIANTLSVFDTDRRLQLLSQTILNKIEKLSSAEAADIEEKLSALTKKPEESETEFTIRKIQTLLQKLNLSYTDTADIETPKTNTSTTVGIGSLIFAVAGAMPYILNVSNAEKLLGDSFSWLALPASIISFGINTLINLGTEVQLGKSFADKLSTGLFTDVGCGWYNTIKSALSVIPAATVAIFYDNVTAKSAKSNMSGAAAGLLGFSSGVVNGLNSLVGALYAIEKLEPKSKLFTDVTNIFTALGKLPEAERNTYFTQLLASNTDTENVSINSRSTSEDTPLLAEQGNSSNRSEFFQPMHNPGRIEALLGTRVAEFFGCR